MESLRGTRLGWAWTNVVYSWAWTKKLKSNACDNQLVGVRELSSRPLFRFDSLHFPQGPDARPLDVSRNPKVRDEFLHEGKKHLLNDSRVDQGAFEAVAPADDRFNCLAFAMGVSSDYVLPLPDWEPVLNHFGFTNVADADLTGSAFVHEEGVEKVVLFGYRFFQPTAESTNAEPSPSHAIVQAEDGTWLSKDGAGPVVRFEHPLDLAWRDGCTAYEPRAVYIRTTSIADPERARREYDELRKSSQVAGEHRQSHEVSHVKSGMFGELWHRLGF
jgi:hypothetical protein